MELISFNGWTFSADSYHGGVPWEVSRNQWSADVRSSGRRNTTPKITGMEFSTREIVCQFVWQGSGTSLIDDVTKLLGLLDIENPKPRTLVAKRPNGTLVERQAIVVLERSQPNEANVLNVRFVSDTVRWSAQSTRSDGPDAVASNGTALLTVDNLGQARACAQLRISSPALSGFFSGDPPKMTSFTVTNLGTRTMVNFPVRVDVGDTSFIVGSNPPTALYQNGRSIRHLVIGAQELKTYCWFAVDTLAAGQTKTFQLVFNGGAGLALVGKYLPAFDIHAEANATTSGSTTTALKRTGATWEVDEWAGARLRILTGALAGQEKLVTSNTIDTIVTSAFGSAPAAGVRYLLTQSQNGKWVYAVRQTERATPRGLWYITPTQTMPQLADFTVPGAFRRELYRDNADRKNQSRWMAATIGGDPDYFALFDADRTHQGGPAIREDGVADGVAISLPFPITGLTADFLFKNPTGMAQFFIGGRVSGAEDYEEFYSTAAASTSLVTTGTLSLSPVGDYTQLYLGLLPANGDEIGADWARDTGTATIGDTGTASSGSTTTVNDNTKAWGSGVWTGYRVIVTGGTNAGLERPITGNSGAQLQVSPAFPVAIDSTSQYTIASRTILTDAKQDWVSGQWVGATLRITDGRGVGASGLVTANTPTTLTANVGVNMDSTSQYEVTSGKIVSTARNGSRFELTWDTANLAISAASAYATVIPMMELPIYVGSSNYAANPSSPPKPYQRVDLGLGATKVLLTSAQTLVIDGEQRRAWIEAGGVEVAQVPPDALNVYDVDAAGLATPAEQWLWTKPGNTTVGTKSAGNSYTVQAVWREGWL